MGRVAATDPLFVARHLLTQVCEPGDQRVGRAVRKLGPEAVAAELDVGRANRLELDHLASRWNPAEVRESAAAEIEIARACGAGFAIPGTLAWPTQLDDLGVRAPLMLRIRGAGLRPAAARSVAIVGARACTSYGARVAEDLAAGLAAAGWTIVSGGAFGIDAAAHRGALAAGGVTVAVSAGGVESAYPRGNHELFGRILGLGGLVVGETPLGSAPNRLRFLVRNRLIAALSRAVVVVEAAARSGARATAREGIEMGRIVAAVPGPVTSAASVGCHALIRDGEAVLASSVAELLELVAPCGADAVSGSGDPSNDDEPSGPGTREVPDAADGAGGLPPAARAVLAVLGSGGIASVEQVASAIGGGEVEAFANLALLETRGLVRREQGGWRSRRSGPAAG